MKPELYYSCLQWVAKRDSLPRSSFIQAQLAEILSLEEELQESLPTSYEDHLLKLGSGVEFGGLSRWIDVDLSREGNVLEIEAPQGFLPVYDSCEGEIFGFYRNGKPFSEKVFVWNGETAPEEYCGSLGDFYIDRLDCSEEEIALIEEEK